MLRYSADRIARQWTLAFPLQWHQVVTSNIAASYTVTGPATYTGTGDWTYNDSPVGNYTIQ